MAEFTIYLPILLLGVVSVHAKEPTDHIDRPPCKGVQDGIFVQDPSSCNGWIQCNNEQSKFGRCKDGYLFDRRTGSCDHKDQVDCANKNPCKGQSDGRFIKIPTSCTKYYVCMKGDPIFGVCANGLYFNEKTQQCVDPKKYPCEPTIPALEDIVCQGLPDYTFVEHEEICGQYFVCINERGRAGHCPDNYLYNPRKGICDYKELVNCPDITPTPQPEKNVCDGIEDGKFINDPSSCPAYFQCINGNAIPGKCDNGLWFNPVNGICDYKENVKCETNLCEEKQNGFIADPEACGKFIQCTNGVGKHGTCPDGYLFNPLNGYCDYKENVDCPQDESTPTPSTSTQTSPPEIPEEPSTESPEPALIKSHAKLLENAAFNDDILDYY